MLPFIGYCTYTLLFCLLIYFGGHGYGVAELAVITILMIIDTIGGITASYVLWVEKGKSFYDDGRLKNDWFSSTILKVGFLSKGFTIMLPFAIIGFVGLAGVETAYLIKILVTGIAGSEIMSIIQKAIIIRTKKPIKEIDALTELFEGILGLVKGIILNRLTTNPYKKP